VRTLDAIDCERCPCFFLPSSFLLHFLFLIQCNDDTACSVTEISNEQRYEQLAPRLLPPVPLFPFPLLWRRTEQGFQQAPFMVGLFLFSFSPFSFFSSEKLIERKEGPSLAKDGAVGGKQPSLPLPPPPPFSVNLRRSSSEKTEVGHLRFKA